jgi:hypothetical protein
MWRGLAGLVVLGACSFQSSAGPIDAASDVPVRQPDAAIDGSVVGPRPFCDPTDPHLVVCYQFEGNTRDGSPHHLDATMTNVSFVPGMVGQAMQFGDTSAADVNNNSLFDVTKLTLEAWIKPSQLPSNGNRADVVDVNSQYALFLRSDGKLTCVLVNIATLTTTTAPIITNQWVHVACTYDGAAAKLYVNGVALETAAGSGAIGTNGTTGLSLAADNPNGSGGQLIGLIDEVRLLDAGRTAEQICADAGKLTCP